MQRYKFSLESNKDSSQRWNQKIGGNVKSGSPEPQWNLDYREEKTNSLKATKTKVPESIMPTLWKANRYSMTLPLTEKNIMSCAAVPILL